MATNVDREYERNHERYAFLRWAQNAFRNFRVVPPGAGIVHQVNLEFLAAVVQTLNKDGTTIALPDTLVGTDSHTTMVNGLGVLGWGVGGIEAEAAMLNQPLPMLAPDVIGVRFSNALREGVTATDLVLTVTEMLRNYGVVGKFVEYCGPGLSNLSLPDRATIANMSPEYGATCGYFPVDAETLRYMKMTGRPATLIDLVERYCRAQGLFRDDATPEPAFTHLLDLDLSTVETSLAGPRRPQDRVPLGRVRESLRSAFVEYFPHIIPTKSEERFDWEGGAANEEEKASRAAAAHRPMKPDGVEIAINGEQVHIDHGSVAIAAITSCTNTSNPSVMLAAGLAGQEGRGARTERLAGRQDEPGAGLAGRDRLPGAGRPDALPRPAALQPGGLRLHDLHRQQRPAGRARRQGHRREQPRRRGGAQRQPQLRGAHPPAGARVVPRLAAAGRRLRPGRHRRYRPAQRAAGARQKAACRSSCATSGRRRRKCSRPSSSRSSRRASARRTTTSSTATSAGGRWTSRRGRSGSGTPNRPTCASRRFVQGIPDEPGAITDIKDARVLVMVGDSVTTDHISPAGSIKLDSPAGKYLQQHEIPPGEFNSYGSRRGNHEVMMRGTFANIRLRNELSAQEGGWTTHQPDGEEMPIYDAAMRYKEEGVPLLVIAGKEFGTGSSRDWAAKGENLLGVKAVIAESHERIHRSNLIGMGVLPLQFLPTESRQTLNLTGKEKYHILGLEQDLIPGKQVTVRVVSDYGTETSFQAIVRIDSRLELEQYRNGGILPYILRKMLRSA